MSFPKGAEGAEVVGAEWVGAEVSNPRFKGFPNMSNISLILLTEIDV